jgi:hypothetical protein
MAAHDFVAGMLHENSHARFEAVLKRRNCAVDSSFGATPLPGSKNSEERPGDAQPAEHARLCMAPRPSRGEEVASTCPALMGA